MKKKKTLSELVNERVNASAKPLIEKYSGEKDAEQRLHLQYDIAKIIGRTTIREIANLSDRDWNRYLKEQVKPFAEFYEKTNQQILDQRLRRGQLNLKDLGLLYAEGEILQRFNLLTRADEKTLDRRRTLERFVTLMGLNYASLLLNLQLQAVNYESFNQLTTIVSKRFNADYHWIVAVGLLATHENLVKKKLVELGVTQGEIEHLSRQRGFVNLIQRLAREIERKEKRQVSLAFYKTSSLRSVRNKLEHEGYRLTVTADDVFELSRDTLRFETELFPNLSPASPSDFPSP